MFYAVPWICKQKRKNAPLSATSAVEMEPAYPRRLGVISMTTVVTEAMKSTAVSFLPHIRKSRATPTSGQHTVFEPVNQANFTARVPWTIFQQPLYVTVSLLCSYSTISRIYTFHISPKISCWSVFRSVYLESTLFTCLRAITIDR